MGPVGGRGQRCKIRIWGFGKGSVLVRQNSESFHTDHGLLRAKQEATPENLWGLSLAWRTEEVVKELKDLCRTTSIHELYTKLKYGLNAPLTF